MFYSKKIERFCALITLVSFLVTCLYTWGAINGRISAKAEISYESRLFDQQRVHTIDIVMEDWSGFLSTCTNEEYVSCSLVIDGESYKNIAIRAKGNTSLSSVAQYGNQRYSFKIEFDHYVSGRSYYGLDKLSLNNLIQDNTGMKDYWAYTFMNQVGVPAPLCSFVKINVNGEYWGLYLAVEGIEESFLQRNYGGIEGELYKPDSMSFGGGRGNGKGFDFDGIKGQFGNLFDGSALEGDDAFESFRSFFTMPQTSGSGQNGALTDENPQSADDGEETGDTSAAETAEEYTDDETAAAAPESGSMPESFSGSFPAAGGMPDFSGMDFSGFTGENGGSFSLPEGMQGFGSAGSEDAAGMNNGAIPSFGGAFSGKMPDMSGIPGGFSMPGSMNPETDGAQETVSGEPEETTAPAETDGEETADLNSGALAMPDGMPDMSGVQFSGMPDMSGTQIPGMPDMSGAQIPGIPDMSGAQIPGMPDMSGSQFSGMPDMSGAQIPGMSDVSGVSAAGFTGAETADTPENAGETAEEPEEAPDGNDSDSGDTGETETNEQPIEEERNAFSNGIPQWGGNGQFSMDSIPDFSEWSGNGFGGRNPFENGAMPAMGNFGMGSSDVRLQYIDDNPDSYSNIFDNAKTDVTASDAARLVASLKTLSEGGEAAQTVVNTEEVMRYLAVHSYMCNEDSYTGMMVHNYYLYEENGVLEILPWDYNLSFGGFSGGNNGTSVVNSAIDNPVSSGSLSDRPLISWIFDSEETIELYHEYYQEFISRIFTSGWFEEEFDRVVAMISPYVEADPTSFCTYEEFVEAADMMKEVMSLRAESVQGQLDGSIPSTSAAQRNSNVLIDGSGMNLSVMGSMNMGGGFNNRFDFGDSQNQNWQSSGWGNPMMNRPGSKENDSRAENGDTGNPGFSPEMFGGMEQFENSRRTDYTREIIELIGSAVLLATAFFVVSRMKRHN